MPSPPTWNPYLNNSRCRAVGVCRGIAKSVLLAVVYTVASSIPQRQPSTITSAISRGDFVLSGLGVPSKAEAGILTAGAAAVAAARPDRIIWLGATGTGVSAPTINRGVAWLLRSGFGAEYDDKTKSEKIIADAGGIVVHSGPLADKEDDPRVILRPLEQATRRFFPYGAPRASIARLMLTLAESPHPAPGTFLIQRI